MAYVLSRARENRREADCERAGSSVAPRNPCKTVPFLATSAVPLARYGCALSVEEARELIRKKAPGASASPSDRLVNLDELPGFATGGWRFVSALGTDRAVIRQGRMRAFHQAGGRVDARGSPRQVSSRRAWACRLLCPSVSAASPTGLRRIRI